MKPVKNTKSKLQKHFHLCLLLCLSWKCANRQIQQRKKEGYQNNSIKNILNWTQRQQRAHTKKIAKIKRTGNKVTNMANICATWNIVCLRIIQSIIYLNWRLYVLCSDGIKHFVFYTGRLYAFKVHWSPGKIATYNRHRHLQHVLEI